MFDAIQYPPYVHPDLKKQIIAVLKCNPGCHAVTKTVAD